MIPGGFRGVQGTASTELGGLGNSFGCSSRQLLIDQTSGADRAIRTYDVDLCTISYIDEKIEESRSDKKLLLIR